MTTATTTPIQDALALLPESADDCPCVEAALAAYEAAAPGSPEETGADLAHDALRAEVQAGLDAWRAYGIDLLTGSDEPREWQLDEDEGRGYDTCVASSAAEALAVARGNVDRDNYTTDPDAGTIYVDYGVRCVLTGEHDEDGATLAPEEPYCDSEAGSHEWVTPVWLVGGIGENPGCWGHGGGVICAEVCRHCGCRRTTDTWAQRRDTGEQGLTEVSYDADHYLDSIAEHAERIATRLRRDIGEDTFASPEALREYVESCSTRATEMPVLCAQVVGLLADLISEAA